MPIAPNVSDEQLIAKAIVPSYHHRINVVRHLFSLPTISFTLLMTQYRCPPVIQLITRRPDANSDNTISYAFGDNIF